MLDNSDLMLPTNDLSLYIEVPEKRGFFGKFLIELAALAATPALASRGWGTYRKRLFRNLTNLACRVYSVGWRVVRVVSPGGSECSQVRKQL
jgi:hypothetical protein